MDLDQTDHTGAVCSGSTVFVYEASHLPSFLLSNILVDDKKHTS